jgi:hypothetical protein
MGKWDDLITRLGSVIRKYGLTEIAPPHGEADFLEPALRVKTAKWYEVDPVAAVSAQYPPDLRDAAIEAAKSFTAPSPFGHRGQVAIQGGVDSGTMPVSVVAYPGRSSLPGNAAGRAIRDAGPERRGLVTLAAGADIGESQFEAALVHELRHALQAGESLSRPSARYSSTTLPRRIYDDEADSFYRYGPASKNYLGGVSEEAVRFADGRARYAQQFGRLIDTPKEAEEAARMILANQHGLGEGFLPDERAFYRAARDASPEISEQQDRLLQRILAIPIAVGAASQLPGE